MYILSFIENLGKYCLFLIHLFKNPTKKKIYLEQILEECIIIGVDSIFIVIVISISLGFVITLQTIYYLKFVIGAKSLIGYAVRELTLSELAPSFISIVFAGKIGSNIAGRISNMRITEQIDALEMMGVNAISYLVLPKIIASLLMYPILITISAFITIYVGYVACLIFPLADSSAYLMGLISRFDVNVIIYMLIKATIFAFITSSIASFKGFYTKGHSSMAIGQVITNAVNTICTTILIAEYFLTKLFMY